MRRGTFGVLVAVFLLLACPAAGFLRASRPPETLTQLIGRLEHSRSPHLVALVRVLSVDSVSVSNEAFLDAPQDSIVAQLRRDLQSRRRLSHLEVIEWLRGGLDGDEIEVGMLEGGLFDLVNMGPPGDVSKLAGVDTIGAVVFLEKQGRGWVFSRGVSESFPHGFRPVPQRAFKAYRESVARGREQSR